jgi:transcriptional regulator with XRE-family HTH domain
VIPFLTYGRKEFVLFMVYKIKVGIKKNNLINILARENWNFSELARRIGYSSSMISLYLKGERIPTAKVRRRMLDALGCEWDDIFYTVESDKS